MDKNIDYSKFKKALQRLAERQDDYLESFNRPELLKTDKEAIVESCIHRFETCFDTLWKHLKKYLEYETGLVEVPNGPRPIFRLAAENLVTEDFETWDNYNQKRIGSSHDYSETKAEETLEIIPAFLNDAIALYEKMTSEKWI